MTFEKVRNIICNQLGKSEDKVTLESSIVEDLGADSLDVVEMLMSIEEETGVVVPDDAIMNLKTVGDVAKYIEHNK